MTLSIVLVDREGNLKNLNVKNFSENELYKRCGFKKDTNFSLRCSISPTINYVQHKFAFYGKSEGNNNFENKYDLLSMLKVKIYGSFAIVAYNENNEPINLYVDNWNFIYEQLKTNCDDLLIDNSLSNILLTNNRQNTNKNINSNMNVNVNTNAKSNTNSNVNVNTNVNMNTNKNTNIQNSNEIEQIEELVEDEYFYSSDEET